MSKIAGSIAAVGTFFGEVKAELKKCTWPTKPELMQSTLVVAVAVGILAAAVGFSDLVLNLLLRLVIR